MAFFQEPPRLGNQYDADRLLRQYIERTVPNEAQPQVGEDLRAMGELAGGELYELQLADRLNEPELVSFDPWATGSTASS